MCIENFLLPGFKILANSLKNTCKGFHFCSHTAGWKHKTLQNWSPSKVFVKYFARIFSNFRRFVRVWRYTYQVQHPLGTIQWLCNANFFFKPTHLYVTLCNKRCNPTHMLYPTFRNWYPIFYWKTVQNKKKQCYSKRQSKMSLIIRLTWTDLRWSIFAKIYFSKIRFLAWILSFLA